MRELVEISPDAIFVIADGHHVFANPSGLAVLGASSVEELRSQPALEYIHESCRLDAIDRMERMTQKGERIEYTEELLRRVDGTIVEIEAAGAPIEVCGQVAALVVARDITSRKKAEADLALAQERWRAAFELAPAGMAIIDTHGVVREANPALARLLDRPVEEIVGHPAVRCMHPDEAPRMYRAVARLLRGTHTLQEGRYRSQRQDGSHAWVWVSTSVMSTSGMLVCHVVDATAQVAAEERLARQASIDPLTGLANRRRIEDRLTRSLDRLNRVEGAVAVLFCDLDLFKAVNDEYGHAGGDEVLREIGQRLLRVVRPGDLVGRIGGDEFAVILDGDARAEDVARRVVEAVSRPLAFRGGWVRVGVSVGIASASEPGRTAGELLAEADAAMYRAKARSPRVAGDTAS
jgi:diguanylate cyclase (GGDEF)-like protein/PAS domain S-box-containing protein